MEKLMAIPLFAVRGALEAALAMYNEQGREADARNVMRRQRRDRVQDLEKLLAVETNAHRRLHKLFDPRSCDLSGGCHSTHALIAAHADVWTILRHARERAAREAEDSWVNVDLFLKFFAFREKKDVIDILRREGGLHYKEIALLLLSRQQRLPIRAEDVERTAGSHPPAGCA
jgi:hypothetical protein